MYVLLLLACHPDLSTGADASSDGDGDSGSTTAADSGGDSGAADSGGDSGAADSGGDSGADSGGDSGADSGSDSGADSGGDSGVEEDPPATPLGSCLADGLGLVETGATAAWPGGLADMEVDADGTLLVITSDGELLIAPRGHLDELTDAGGFGGYAAQIDLTDGTTYVSADGARVGDVSLDPVYWSTLRGPWGDGTVSPDGQRIAYTYAGCGIEWGVVDTADGSYSYLDRATERFYPMAFEYLDDGRLVAATSDLGAATGIEVFTGDTRTDAWSIDGYAVWFGVLETLGTEVVVPTGGDGTAGTLVRLDVDSGAMVTAPLPFAWASAVAIDPMLVWATDWGGTVVAADADATYDLGSFGALLDLVADPDGEWIATAGYDGVVRTYACE